MKVIYLEDPEITCLYSLVRSRQITGEYSGNKEQYYKRLETILTKLEKVYNGDNNE